ncbi:MAG: AtpZ/AtpI family protein [Actinobacteria bacterium]|uniref:AtpZ/AtpI family protein n=1 Tax=Nostocoides veronense TaxID=330836 RepID=A0ABN2LXM3_9MICO|nr:AtpZ/AtpI family protein [Actinomycetota bacterium]
MSGSDEEPLTPLQRKDSGHPGNQNPPMWDALSYVLAGPLTFGIPAYLLDRWLGTSWIVLPGVLIGMAVSLYAVWVRYGRG